MGDGLSIRGLSAWYGSIQVLRGIDLDVGRRSVVALMGRNGMGKTTTIRSVFGMVGRREGRISIDNQDISDLPSFKVARMGIGLVPEGRRCFQKLSVRENLISAARPGPWNLQKICELFPVLGSRANQSASSLSGGEQQMLSIGRALATNPAVLLLDEATEGLAPLVRAEIWEAIHALKAEGVGLLLIDKSISELKNVADSCVIMEKGQVAWAGSPDELDDAIIREKLGV